MLKSGLPVGQNPIEITDSPDVLVDEEHVGDSHGAAADGSDRHQLRDVRSIEPEEDDEDP